MQITGQPVRVVNGSAFVELLTVVSLTGITGTFAAGETVSFTGGASGRIVATVAPEISVAVTSVQQPLLGDVATSSGGATGTLAAFATQPDLAGAGVDGEEWFLREGDGVSYTITAAPSNSRLQLSAPYGGASSVADEALGTIHTTRTPLQGLPDFDRRDRNLAVMLRELVRLLDAQLADHEARIAALEP